MLSPAQIAILDAYLKAILERNKFLNLTNIRNTDEAQVLHLEDSLVGLDEILKAPAGPLVDLGSGGGFPGVPLAVVTKRQTTLVDSTKKKMDAVAAVLEDLGIEGVSTYAGRIEDLAQERAESFTVATARALAPIPVLLELAAPLLCIGGWLVAYKSAEIEEELQRAATLEQKLGMKQKSVRTLTLSDGATKRSIVVYEKVAEPMVALPRRTGVAQKRPYA